MKKEMVAILVLTISVLSLIRGQTSSPVKAQQDKQIEDESVVRVSTKLVQVDVTVTDEKGVQIIDLRPEEFEVYEDGRRQEITAFTFVGLRADQRPTEAVGVANNSRNYPVPPPLKIRAEQVRRTLAVLVDDECMSFTSTFAIRDELKKFLDNRLEPDDLVGVFRTSRGNAMLQQFTTNRAQLQLAVRSILWRPTPTNAVDFFESSRRDFEDAAIKGELTRTRDSSSRSEGSQRTARSDYFSLNDDLLDRPCRRFLRLFPFLLHNMRKLPGRKAIAYLSDGTGLNTWLEDKLRAITDYANRSGVAIYAVDARGLVNTDYIGADEVITASDVGSDRTTQLRNARAGALVEGFGGLRYLADRTGGTFTRNNSDLGKGLRQALEEQRGYYLIGYRPADETFKNGLRSYHRIEVKVKRPDVRVRTRKGFIGVPDEVLALPPQPRTENSDLYEALASPLAHDDVRLRLTPDISYDAAGSPRFRALVHIDASQTTFADEANGWKKIVLDVAGATLAEDGRVANEFTRTHTVKIGPETVALVRANGLTYSTDVPITRFGAYQFRIIVRDASSKKYGTAVQFLTIPDLRKNIFALSGLMLTEADAGTQQLPATTSVDAALGLVLTSSDPAVRRFSAGATLNYEYLIHNPRVNKKGQPHLTAQVRLFRGGQEVFVGPETAVTLSADSTAQRIIQHGSLSLPPKLEPGEYVLQIILNDDKSGEKRRTVSQWIDFEVVTTSSPLP